MACCCSTGQLDEHCRSAAASFGLGSSTGYSSKTTPFRRQLADLGVQRPRLRSLRALTRLGRERRQPSLQRPLRLELRRRSSRLPRRPGPSFSDRAEANLGSCPISGGHLNWGSCAWQERALSLHATGAWRNGNRRALKMLRPLGLAGSSPAAPTSKPPRAGLPRVRWTSGSARRSNAFGLGIGAADDLDQEAGDCGLVHQLDTSRNLNWRGRSSPAPWPCR